ncbi:phospholipase D-like domain-containing protein [Amphibacillus sp. Q70]|uniref:phospholipase D-like domain-containing protein n=1 Tax=Amphibacillus sp. Q70 TaxID=3453416 RepID=UPI003F86D560
MVVEDERCENMLNTLKSLTKYILLGYFIYILITGVLLFSFSPETESLANEIEDPWISDTTEEAVLVEDRSDALKARFDLMNAAEDTLDISYYSMQGGATVDLFYAHILKAADRGVKVRFLVDGIFHNIYLGQRDVIRLFTEHPNIELSFYESLDLLRPWTWHNRLHDKFIIADQSMALIGGRNIGDKYFAPDDYQTITNDRDLLLFNQDQENSPITEQMQTYFDYLWEHEYTEQQTNRNLTSIGKKRAQRMREEIMETYQIYHERYLDFFTEFIDWNERSHEIDRGFFVHNSIDRFLKEPQVWQQMLELAVGAEDQITIQSPYIIPNRLMREDIDRLDLEINQGKILTNGLNASPNLVAHSGYRNHRQNLSDTNFDLYEYQHSNQSLHMKSIMIDQQIVATGSFNFDARSTYLNTESMLVLDSPTLTKEMLDMVEEQYMPDSFLVDETSSEQEMLETRPVIKEIFVFILRPLARSVEFLL